MQADITNLRSTIVPKSDQLNAEQLLAGPMTVTVTDVRVGSTDEQPIAVHYKGEAGRPFKPCKTMRKVLVLGWGPDGREWIGRTMTLFNDPAVKWGGAEVGGVRISHMSDIPQDIHVQLTATRGKKAPFAIKRLAADPHLAAISTAATMPDLQAAFTAATKSTRDAAARQRYVDAKDARKRALEAPEPAGEALAGDDDGFGTLTP